MVPMKNIARKHVAKRGLLAILAICLVTVTGCATSGIMKDPDLEKLAYDEDGILRYDGLVIEGIKFSLPWYKEMWPDNGAEWGFSLVTLGAGMGVGGAISGGESSGDAPEEVVEETPSAATGSGSGSGGGGTPAAPPAAPAGGGGGGDESPW